MSHTKKGDILDDAGEKKSWHGVNPRVTRAQSDASCFEFLVYVGEFK